MTAPAEHPSWCDRQHSAEWSTHTAQVGADLELTAELLYAVMLWQQGDEPTEVHLMRHSAEETSFTRFSIVQASVMRDLLSEALQAVAREVGQ